MFYDYLSVFFGVLKICFYKLLYWNRIQISGFPKMNSSFKIAIKKGSKLILGKKIRTRNNVSFRIYENGEVKIGDHCFFNDGCSINCQDKITFGSNIICGQNVQFFDHDHDYKNDMKSFVTSEIKVGNYVWIGANVLILKGVSIGDHAVIAGGTIVTKNIPSNMMVKNEVTYNMRKITNKYLEN